MSNIIGADGDKIEVKRKLPKVKGVHPLMSQVLVEEIRHVDTIDTELVLDENMKTSTAAQAYIIEVGPQLSEDFGLKVGMRIHWSGTGLPVDDPRAEKGLVRALLEPHQIRAVIEEVE